MKKFRTTMITLFLVFAVSSSAIANGLSLNSIGTKALGMGGAFVGLANDGSAIYWNPAGLAGLESSVLVSYTGIIPSATYKNDAAGVDASSVSQIHSAPSLFANYTTGDWSFGLGIFVPAGLGIEWDGAELLNLTQGNPYDWYSRIGVIDFAPAVAYKVSDQLSFGLTVNIFYGMFDLKRPQSFDMTGDNIANISSQYVEESTGMGYGVTIGGLYKFSDQFQIGLSFRSSTKVAMEGTATQPIQGMMGLPEESSFERDVEWPMWIAGGLAYKPTECWTLTLDAQYSNWAKLETLTATYTDWNGMEGEFELDWIDQVQIRLGGEYMASKEIAVRLGYYYDPAPAPDETLNILFPSSTNHVATAGFGYYAEKFSVEAGLEYLFGAERDIDSAPANEPYPLNWTNMPGLHKMDVFAFSIGFGYKF